MLRTLARLECKRRFFDLKCAAGARNLRPTNVRSGDPNSERRASKDIPLIDTVLRRGLVVVERNAIQLEPVVDQLVAELARDLGLQLLDFLGGEFDHLAVAQIDQVVVMAVAHLLVAGAALAEIMSLDDAGVLEQLDR